MVTVSELNPVDDKKARLKHLIKNLPNLPGVYKMLGKNGDILYVGKAKSLKSRVNSYFAKTIDHPKTRALVARIHNIETIITRSETEALLLDVWRMDAVKAIIKKVVSLAHFPLPMQQKKRWC